MLLKNKSNKILINTRKKINSKKFLETFILPFETKKGNNIKDNISENMNEYLLKIR